MATNKSKTTTKTTTKTATPKTATTPTQAARTVGGGEIPTTMLDGWMRQRRLQWGNEEWQGLLQDLRTQGMNGLADTDEGRQMVGRYLEDARRRELQNTMQALKPIRADLDTWVDHRQGWNHDEWMGLLDGLRRNGYAKEVEDQQTRMAIGLYIEETRARRNR